MPKCTARFFPCFLLPVIRGNIVRPFFLMVLLIAVAVLSTVMITGNRQSETASAESVQQFVDRHWQTPVPLQGKVPGDYSELESSLLPESCGSCHEPQYRDWKTSLHSKAMGPGVYGQTLVMEESDPATARVCWSCHAPLSEQQPLLLKTAQNGKKKWVANPAFDPRLQQHGLSCAVCHVRKHERIGPPRRSTPEVTGKIDEGLPHGGFVAEPVFSKSIFCKGCHQFGPDGYALNGKLIENTYQEWLESDYPAKGVECQSCHMPDRRHLWRGIHDPEMTRKGVTITTEVSGKTVQVGDKLEMLVTISNTGTGHHFPTYLTPRVVVSGYQIDRSGKTIPDTTQEAVIGREVTLNLSEEIFDTRIPSGESSFFRYSQTRSEHASRLIVIVQVEPNYFYEKFFRAMLEGDSAGKGRELIRQAWEQARSTPYTLYRKEIKLQ